MGHYREHRVGRALSRHVACIWATSGGASMRVLPDGCVDWYGSPGSTVGWRVVGTMTRALVVDAASVIGIRFLPGAASALLGVPVHPLTDADDALRPDLARGLGLSLTPAALEQRLLAAFAKAEPIERFVTRAAGLLWEDPALTIRGLAATLGLTRQHLARVFTERVGVGPKQFARVARMRRTLAGLSVGAVDWASVAAERGYCDQAHLVHELGELAGVTPTAWLRERSSISPSG